MKRTEQEMASPVKDTSIFLLGKTGHGKSSTGNTVLGREAFHTSDGVVSDTNTIQAAWGRFYDETVKVVDGPGVCETRLSRGEAAKKMLEDMRAGMFCCPNGFDIMVLVLRYGTRFTQEEYDAISALKSCFGENFLRDFGVIVFTHGEQFDMENRRRRDNRSFPEWVNTQDGPLMDILRECGGRYVLFHNLDETKRDEEVWALLSLANELKSGGRRYTQDLFDQIKAEHDKFYARENATELKEKMQRKIDLLQDSLSRVISMDGSSDLNTLMVELDKLLEDVWHLKMEINNEDKQTGVLRSIMSTVEILETTIRNHKDKFQERQTADVILAERQNLAATLEDMQQQLNDLRLANTPNPSSHGFVDTLKKIGRVLLGAAGVAGGVLCTIRGQVGTGLALMHGGLNALTLRDKDD